MRRTLMLCVLLFLNIGCSRAAGVDLGWDLSYASAVSSRYIDPREFMTVWVKTLSPQRPIAKQMASYEGEEIEASLLIELPDGHTGDPLAAWYIKTRAGARVCGSHPKKPEGECGQLEPARIEALVREVANFKKIAYDPDPKMTLPTGGGSIAGESNRLNYVGLLSVYLHGKSFQRAIHAEEYLISERGYRAVATEDGGRLVRAISKATLTPEAYQKEERELRRKSLEASLREAVAMGDMTKIREMLDKNGDRGLAETTLAAGVRYGRLDIVQMAVARGANVRFLDNDPLRIAAQEGLIEIGTYLIAQGAEINPKGRVVNSPPLTVAVEAGRLPFVEFLLKQGADPEGSGFRNPLAIAMSKRDIAMANLLLDYGAKPDPAGSRDWPVLLSIVGKPPVGSREPPEDTAALQKRIAVIERLILAGARVRATGPGCQTPYDTAYPEEVQKLLLKHGADPDMRQLCRKSLKWKDPE